MNYKSGIYTPTSSDVEGGHAIKIVGYGTDNVEGENVDYWLCANSWDTTWGISGYFKIKQGECGIEEQVYACTPATNN